MSNSIRDEVKDAIVETLALNNADTESYNRELASYIADKVFGVLGIDEKTQDLSVDDIVCHPADCKR